MGYFEGSSGGGEDFFGTFNVIRMLKMCSAMPSFPIKDVAIESNSNIAFGGKIGGGKIAFKVVVPKTHIAEVMTAVMPKPAAKIEDSGHNHNHN